LRKKDHAFEPADSILTQHSNINQHWSCAMAIVTGLHCHAEYAQHADVVVLTPALHHENSPQLCYS
jgi:hypothetical protein